MGHLKFASSAISNTSKAWQAHLRLSDLPSHPYNGVRYFMFLYTFDPESLDILETSHAFIPPTATSNVIFPAGLVVENNRIIISYGEGDCAMKLLFIPTADLNQLLISNMKPEDFDFIRY